MKSRGLHKYGITKQTVIGMSSFQIVDKDQCQKSYNATFHNGSNINIMRIPLT